MAAPETESPQRLPLLTYVQRDMKDWIRTRAKREGRSQSNMVETLLREAMDEERANAA